MSATADRPLTLLVAAIGGEGGGVLASWLVDAASAARLPVQSTSIPGVAQRTGATTYYIEIFPRTVDELAGRRPILALTPSPGDVDVVVASELIEAGRALQNGYVSPDRTTLIASTHRVYAIGEKVAMGDGRFDGQQVRRAADELARRAVMFDMRRLARGSGSIINAVLFGALAGAGCLPWPREAGEAAIRRSGVGVEASLRGFAAGFACASGAQPPPVEDGAAPRNAEHPHDRVRREFPIETHRILEEGVSRLADYQDEAYAALYLDRLAMVRALDRPTEGWRLSRETGRYLALWMSYEDVIRVADLKSRPERIARVRAEVGAKPDEPVKLVEYLKPGLDEWASLLPQTPARLLRRIADAAGLGDKLNIGLHIHTTSLFGFGLFRLLAGCRRWRRRTSRFVEEQALIERWLAATRAAAVHDLARACEIAELPRLIKGYGDTHRRGRQNFLRIFEVLVELQPAPAAAIAKARQAALADPEGESLTKTLAELISAQYLDPPLAMPAPPPEARRAAGE